MKKEVRKMLKIEESLDEKLSEIEWIIALPIENDAKANIIRKILTGIKLDVAKTQYESMIDGQTGLLNKNSLAKLFKAKQEEAVEKSSYLSLIIADLDYLKKYNDSLGHLAGDIVIKQCSEVVKKSLRKSDIAFRYGGDEFVLLCVHKKAKGAKVISERIIKNNKILNKEREHPFSVTIGYATAKKQGITSFRELFEVADKMLYERKSKNTMPDFLKNKIDGK